MNSFYISGSVYWETETETLDEAFTELCDAINRYNLPLDIIVDYGMELRNEDGDVIE